MKLRSTSIPISSEALSLSEQPCTRTLAAECWQSSLNGKRLPASLASSVTFTEWQKKFNACDHFLAHSLQIMDPPATASTGMTVP